MRHTRIRLRTQAGRRGKGRAVARWMRRHTRTERDRHYRIARAERERPELAWEEPRCHT